MDTERFDWREENYERPCENMFREYSELEHPVDMGKWVSYMPYHDAEQLELQRSNILRVPLANAYGPVGFILSKNICSLEAFLEEISCEVRVEDAETVLETEVFYTSKIEGAKTTRKRTSEVHNGCKINRADFSDCMLKGNFEAVKMLNLYGNGITSEKLLRVWEVLTEGCRENSDIAGELYRSDEIGILGSAFASVPPENVEKEMGKLISFYEGGLLDDKPFVKAALIHFAFETIHPFCDGNGRLGRLLINNYLIGRGVESCRAVSFSMQIDRKRGLYDAAFEDSENKYGDATPFVEFMLQAMADSYITALDAQSAAM